MKIIGLDQSTKLTGWSLWQDKQLVEHGVLTVKVKENLPLVRMEEMYNLLKELTNKHKPDFVVLEAVQFQNNFNTYGQLSQLQGVIFPLLFERDIGFVICEPTKWRSFFSIKGRKRAEYKEAAIQMVKDKWDVDATEDEAEAILIGCWGTYHS